MPINLQLAVNIGNTNLRLAIKKTSEQIDIPRIANNSVSNMTAVSLPVAGLQKQNDFIKFIEEKFGADIWRQLTFCIVSSVVPSKTNLVLDSLRHMTGILPKTMDEIDFSNLLCDDYRPGDDRLACCAGALNKYASPMIVYDFGTTTTANVINNDGIFTGGAIWPGVLLSLTALSEGSPILRNNILQYDLLRHDYVKSKVNLIGQNTKENMLAGVIIGAACCTKEYSNRIKRELTVANELNIVITGGHAEIVLPYCEFNYHYEPTLVLDGLFFLCSKYLEGLGNNAAME